MVAYHPVRENYGNAVWRSDHYVKARLFFDASTTGDSNDHGAHGHQDCGGVLVDIDRTSSTLAKRRCLGANQCHLETAIPVSTLLPKARSLAVSCGNESAGDIRSALGDFRQIRSLQLRNLTVSQGAVFLACLQDIVDSGPNPKTQLGQLSGLMGLQTLHIYFS